jgi:hypothetical protein
MTHVRTINSFVSKWQAVATRLDISFLIAISTAVVLLLISHSWFYKLLSLAVLVVVLLSPGARVQPWMWLAVCIAWLPKLVFNWCRNEDHVYLTIYWCLALGLAYAGKDPLRVLAWNARLLIGLTFALAVFWKIAMPDFRDGELLHYKLLFDYRLRQSIAENLGGLTNEQTRINLQRLRSIRTTGSHVESVQLEYPDRLSFVAMTMTWWTIAIEGILAFLFLGPDRWHLSRVRNVPLIVFGLSTYLIVPVLGFGSLFMTMGFAQCRANEHKTRLAYVGAQMVLLLSWVGRTGI